MWDPARGRPRATHLRSGQGPSLRAPRSRRLPCGTRPAGGRGPPTSAQAFGLRCARRVRGLHGCQASEGVAGSPRNPEPGNLNLGTVLNPNFFGRRWNFWSLRWTLGRIYSYRRRCGRLRRSKFGLRTVPKFGFRGEPATPSGAWHPCKRRGSGARSEGRSPERRWVAADARGRVPQDPVPQDPSRGGLGAR